MRLIDADLLKENWGKFDHRRRLVECINEQPTVEVAPVVRGKWVSSNSGKWQCSVCEEFSFAKIECDDGDLYLETDYCPNCGAMM